ncbi:MAG: replication initiation protein [Suipraeoptans sp.]
MATIRNKDLLQSYVLTTAKYDFSVYEKRIIYRIIEMLQQYTEDKKLNQKYNVDIDLFGDAHVTMPISAFLKDESDKHYTEIKKALTSLENKRMDYEDDKTWQIIRLIEKPRINKYDSFVTFRLDSMIYHAFLDFSKGYRKYELKTAMGFESIYTMRFYELLSGQKTPLCYSIDQLKEMFQIHDKYERVNDFKKYVLGIAKRELDKCSPYTFNYEMNKTGRKFTSVTFYPKYQPQFRDTDLEKHELQKQVSLSWDLPKEVTDYLKHNFDFTTDGIKNNLDLFKLAHEQLDVIGFLASLKGKIRQSNNPQGYIIGALKKQLQ